jgi:hypothetical protein
LLTVQYVKDGRGETGELLVNEGWKEESKGRIISLPNQNGSMTVVRAA